MRSRAGQVRRTNLARAVPIDGQYVPPERKPLRDSLARGALALLPMAALGVWAWSLGAERRAIYSLPADERAVVYADTIQAFDAACNPPRAGLTSHCRSQASFLLNFPECDDHCRGVAAPLLHWRRV
jgi:hypothetical protein